MTRPATCSDRRNSGPVHRPQIAARVLGPWIHIPAGFYRNIYHHTIPWQFETEP
jgi:hypothetical protein